MNLKSTFSLLAFVLVTYGCSQNSQTDHYNNDEFFELIRTQKVASDDIVQWHNIGPGMSGYNEEFWSSPNNPDVMFMGPDMHVTYGSWDAGESWHSVMDPDSLGQQMKRVVDMSFSHQDANFAMALDWNGWVYQTTDQGHNWQKTAELSSNYSSIIDNPYDPLAFKKGWYDEQLSKRLSTIVVDPTDDNIWYVGAGDFWNIKENHRSASNPQGSNLSYAEYGYIQKSNDKGKTWQKITNGLPANLDVGKIVINPTSPEHLLMATNHGLMISRDGGLTWHKGGKGLANNIPRDLTSYYNKEKGEFELFLIDQTSYHPKGKSVTSTGGIYRSIDSGESWQNITGNLAIDLTQITYPAEINRYYRTLANWFGISQQQARKDYSSLPTSVLPVFNRLVVNPLSNNEIYLTYNKKHDRTFGPGEVWRTLDGGKNWLVVARHGKYWLSQNDSEYWASRNNPTNANVEFAHVQTYMDAHTEDQGNRLLEINANGELFISVGQQSQRSSDKGETWQQIDDVETAPGSNIWIGRGNSDLPGRFMHHETGIKGRRLFASGEHGVWQTVPIANSSDPQAVALKQIEGQVNIAGMVSISTLAVHPNNPDIIYILAWRQEHKGELRRSVDGGKTWQNIATVLDVSNEPNQLKSLGKIIQGPPGMLPAQNSLLIDPKNPDNMYVAATKEAFSEIYRAPRRQPIKGGFGFLKSTDGGYHWKLSNSGFHDNFSLRRIVFDPNNANTLYAATNDENGGLYKSTDQGENWQKMAIPSGIKSVNNVFIDRNNHHMIISAGGFYSGAYNEGGAWRSKDSGKTWQKIFKAPVILQVESSPVDPQLLVLTAGNQMRLDRQFMNPGIYLSQDGGESWKKINKDLANFDKMIDAKPDPYNANVLWAAGWGSGWYVGYIGGTEAGSWIEQ